MPVYVCVCACVRACACVHTFVLCACVFVPVMPHSRTFAIEQKIERLGRTWSYYVKVSAYIAMFVCVCVSSVTGTVSSV